MGHAGAVISGGHDTADHKIEALKSAGIRVADSPARLGDAMVEALQVRASLGQQRTPTRSLARAIGT
jgi:succinyl-CoA synthetase alpha subunit